MFEKLLAAVIVIGSLLAVPVYTRAAESHDPSRGIVLSADLLNLLVEEMRAIAAGVQGVALSLAYGDWKSIEETAEKIQASYIMEQKLTASQARELQQALPGHFKQLDAEFHSRAGRLGAAAAAHDPELVAFHYSRLMESCALCHAAYAGKRFPGFSTHVQQGHHH
ncbi:MAG: cytochrome c [Gammaproteobacteria bacterium]